jgi:hypothetical protein
LIRTSTPIFSSTLQRNCLSLEPPSMRTLKSANPTESISS